MAYFSRGSRGDYISLLFLASRACQHSLAYVVSPSKPAEAVLAFFTLCHSDTDSSIYGVQLFATSWTIACQAPLSIEFSRKEYWSGLAFPSPGESSRSRNQTQVSCIAGRFFTVWASREAPIDRPTIYHLSVDQSINLSIDPQWPLPLPLWLSSSELICYLPGHCAQ